MAPKETEAGRCIATVFFIIPVCDLAAAGYFDREGMQATRQETAHSSYGLQSFDILFNGTKQFGAAYSREAQSLAQVLTMLFSIIS